jgi:hypothetical protein
MIVERTKVKFKQVYDTELQKLEQYQCSVSMFSELVNFVSISIQQILNIFIISILVYFLIRIAIIVSTES